MCLLHGYTYQLQYFLTVTTLSHNTCNSIPGTRLYIRFTFLGQQNSCWEVGVFPGWSPVQCWLNLVTSGESSYPQHLWYKLTPGISSCFPPRFSLCPDENVESTVYTTIGVTRSLSQKAPTLNIEHSWRVWYVCYVLSSKTMETFTYFSTREWHCPKILTLMYGTTYNMDKKKVGKGQKQSCHFCVISKFPDISLTHRSNIFPS